MSAILVYNMTLKITMPKTIILWYSVHSEKSIPSSPPPPLPAFAFRLHTHETTLKYIQRHKQTIRHLFTNTSPPHICVYSRHPSLTQISIYNLFKHKISGYKQFYWKSLPLLCSLHSDTTFGSPEKIMRGAIDHIT